MPTRLVLSFLLLSSFTLAQETPNRSHMVRASGEASISAKPDRAEISIGVSTSSPTAEAAASQNARESEQVLQALKTAISSGGKLKTAGYSIGPEYEYPPGGRGPKLIGYRATNTVQVTLDDLGLVGKVIDSATQAGANSVNGVSFTLRNDEAIRAEALAQAAIKARQSAEAIAKALNLRVVGVLEAQTAEAPIVHPLAVMTGAMPKMQASTPIETGTLDVAATVVVTLQVQ